MICVLCDECIGPNDDAVKPGPLWPWVHAECWAAEDDADEADSRTTTYHAQNQGDAMESLQ